MRCATCNTSALLKLSQKQVFHTVKFIVFLVPLQANIQREKLRADFYEEMVSFGKEVYGIDLKKAGTK